MTFSHSGVVHWRAKIGRFEVRLQRYISVTDSYHFKDPMLYNRKDEKFCEDSRGVHKKFTG